METASKKAKQVLTSSTVNWPPPYHVFKTQEGCFAYDTTSCRFIRIDPPTLRFLELCRSHTVDDAKSIMLGDGEFQKTTVESVAEEVAMLAKGGFFVSPDYSINEARLEKELRQRYDNAPWNKLELALSETCNLACTYCYCGTCRDILPHQGLMSETVARQAINWLFAVSGKSESVSITFFGGEPLLNKPVFHFAVAYSQRLAKLHGKRVFYSMTTNGTLLDDDVITAIKRYNFGLMVSLDGPPDIHNAQCPMRGGDGSFDAAAAGIRRLMERRRSVTVRCTMAHPAPEMMRLIRYFEDFGFTRIVLGRVVNPVHESPADFTDEDFASCERQEEEELIPWILDKLAHGERPKYYPYAHFVEEQEKGIESVGVKVSPFKCGACRGTTTVGADGTLYPCHRFVGMDAWRIGTMADGPDYEKCKQFWRDYRACVASKCERCWLWAQCKGPCPWEIAQVDGTFNLDERHCEQMEKHLKKAVAFYSRLKAAQAQKGMEDVTKAVEDKYET